jgi:hypothetical protein
MAQNASADWQRRYDEEREAASLADNKRQEAERDMAGRLNDLDAKLKKAEDMVATLRAESHEWTQPEINPAIFELNPVTRSNPQGSGSVDKIELRRSLKRFTILVHLEGELSYEDYRVTIFRDNRLVWTNTGFRPNKFGALSATFKSSFFQPGPYYLQVDGITKQRDFNLLGSYRFQVIKAR